MSVTVNTLATFNGGNGEIPKDGLISDAAGDLFGTTIGGGANIDGTVFEIVKTGSTYGAPGTLATFNGTGNGANPVGSLISDAAGDLFGTTQAGGTNGDGTVFEIGKTGSTYGAPVTLATFNGNGTGNGSSLEGSLISDAAGDLFGTTEKGGADNDGTVFEIVKTGSSYGAPVTLATFTGTGNGANPQGSLISDAAGDLFGTTQAGGANGDGTVFEIVKTGSTYGAPVTLATFNGTGNGTSPYGSLISDAAGDLFGTTWKGGANNDGTVFEIVKTGSSYGAPVTLATFAGTGNGANPSGSLISDAAGDLFGTTQGGGDTQNDGTVFEVAKTASGYGALTTVLTFNGASNGSTPYANLISDAADDLFGTTGDGGANGEGTVFEITGSGFFELAITTTGGSASQLSQTISGTIDVNDAGETVSIYDGSTLIGTTRSSGTGAWSATVKLLSTHNAETITAQATDAAGAVGTSNSVTYTLLNAVDPVSDLNGDGMSDVIFQNGGTFTEWQSTGNNFSPNVYVNTLGTGWSLAGIGDFNGDGKSDLIFQNGGTYTEWQSTGNSFTPNVSVFSVGAGWNLAGVGDFNGDGKSDLIFQNGGTFTEWQSTGDSNNSFTPNVSVFSVGAGWNLAGVGDFNGDGKSDLIFQNGGTFTEWQSTGNSFTPNVYVNTVGAGWTLVGVGDFNGDGKSDLIFQNGGTFTEWQSTGNGFTPNVVVDTLGAGWSVAAIGDFNGDGLSDILFRNTNGTFTEWQSTGTGFTQNVVVNTTVGNAWTLEYSPTGASGTPGAPAGLAASISTPNAASSGIGEGGLITTDPTIGMLNQQSSLLANPPQLFGSHPT